MEKVDGTWPATSPSFMKSIQIPGLNSLFDFLKIASPQVPFMSISRALNEMEAQENTRKNKNTKWPTSGSAKELPK